MYNTLVTEMIFLYTMAVLCAPHKHMMFKRIATMHFYVHMDVPVDKSIHENHLSKKVRY